MSDDKHHHHHHHHHKDDAEKFKDEQLRAQRLKKSFSKILFYAGVVVATVIVLAVLWLYTNN